MTKKSFEAIRRADHVLLGALAMFIATVSAAAGAAAVYNPHTDQIASAKPAIVHVVQQAAVPASPLDGVPTGSSVVIDAASVHNASVTVAAPSQDPVMVELLREHRCLSDALYYEARGEGKQGEMAIAEVIFTRLRKGTYGHSICNVVYAGAGRHGCQFSFACDGKSLRRPRAYAAWQRAQYLAAQIMVGQARLTNITEGATNFHSAAVNPDWAFEMEKTTQIGNHIFYKTPPRSRAL